MIENEQPHDRRRIEQDSFLALHNTLLEVQRTATEIRDKVKDIEANQENIESAFSKNDLGRLDYDGHRRDHLEIQKSHRVLEKYKFDITKSMLIWALIGIVTIFFSGVIHQIALILKVPVI